MTWSEAVPGIPGAVMRRVPSLPHALAGAEALGTTTYAMPGQLLFAVPGTGRFLARGGVTIDFAEDDGADPGKVQLFLHGTARGALIHQRGELPLHAATLVPPRGGPALAICGASGAGKSTLAAELSRRGWVLVADDTTRLTWDGKRPIAWPSRDSIKLWRDACEASGVDCAVLAQVTRDMEKYYLPVPARQEPAPLRFILELVTQGEPTTAATLGEKMALISRNTYRPSHIRPLGKQQDHVKAVAQVATVCEMIRLKGGGALPLRALADTVEKTCDEHSLT
jgi:hypothetical protein